MINHQILLAELPEGALQERHFATATSRVADPGPGEVLVRTILLSIDPATRAWMAGRTYRSQLQADTVMPGSAAKNRLLEAELGFDATLNHHSPALYDDLKGACPTGVDVYFDNVGGRVLETVLPQMNTHGTIVCCGVVSQYDTAAPAPGPRSVPGLLVTKRLRMQGFLVTDYRDRWATAETQL